MTATSESHRCVATTIAGARCRNAITVYGPGRQLCSRHLPADEMAAGRAAIPDWTVELELPAEPACWSWPVTDEIREHLAAAEQATDRMTRARYRVAAMTLFSEDRCGLCGVRSAADVEDHDHVTGLVRGRLCRGCNAREGHDRSGMVGDGVFARYRRRHPTAILGLKDPYDGWGWINGERAGVSHIPATADDLAAAARNCFGGAL